MRNADGAGLETEGVDPELIRRIKELRATSVPELDTSGLTRQEIETIQTYQQTLKDDAANWEAVAWVLAEGKPHLEAQVREAFGDPPGGS